MLIQEHCVENYTLIIMSNEEDSAQSMMDGVVTTTGTTVVPMNIPMPTQLDVSSNLPANWKRFSQMWDNYSIVAQLKSQTEEYRIATFLTAIGPEALDIYNGLECDKSKLKCISAAFKVFAVGELNETYERYMFNTRDQKEDESIDCYVTALRTLAKTCKFDALNDSLIRDRIVIGVNDANLRKRLLQKRDMTLNSCIDMCRSSEATNAQLQTISPADPVNWIRPKTSRPREERRTQKNQHWKHAACDTPSMECNFCGYDHEPDRGKCPAYKKKCNKCGKNNHFAKKCRAHISNTHGITVNDPHNVNDPHDDYIASVTLKSPAEDEETPCTVPVIHADMSVGSKRIRFQVDCGATVNILPERLLDPSLHVNLVSTNRVLKMWNKAEVKPIGCARLSIQNPANRRSYSIEFMIVRDTPDAQLSPILGANAVVQMDIVRLNQKNYCVHREDGNAMRNEMMQKHRSAHHRNAKDMRPLQPGDNVKMKQFKLGQKYWKWKRGVVKKRLDERSYEIVTQNGTFWRNRVHLRLDTPPMKLLIVHTAPSQRALCGAT